MPLAFEGARYRVRIFRNDRQKHLRRFVGPMRALLPIPNRAEREMETRGKFLSTANLRNYLNLFNDLAGNNTTPAREEALSRA